MPYKNILIAVTGGVAAYKICELIRLFVKAAINVRVIMTPNAHNFIHPNLFAALSGNDVHTDMFADAMLHIELAKWADCMLIAPATAATISKLSTGNADNLLTSVALATTAPIFLAPAMNKNMWQQQVVADNVLTLEKYGYKIIPPTHGKQACGDIGYGRMAEIETIFQYLTTNNKFKNTTILITAGSTQEKIDPVRYISNYSSGKMGYAIARAFVNLGAKVILISGPTSIKAPNVHKLINVNSAEEMATAVHNNLTNTDIIIGAAAVADYTPLDYSPIKIKKQNNDLIIKLKKTQDILESLKTHNDIYKVGFCAETNDLIANAKNKIKRKNLDAIFANEVLQDGFPFGHDSNKLTFINKAGTIINMEQDSKDALAIKITAIIMDNYKEKLIHKPCDNINVNDEVKL